MANEQPIPATNFDPQQTITLATSIVKKCYGLRGYYHTENALLRPEPPETVPISHIKDGQRKNIAWFNESLLRIEARNKEIIEKCTMIQAMPESMRIEVSINEVRNLIVQSVTDFQKIQQRHVLFKSFRETLRKQSELKQELIMEFGKNIISEREFSVYIRNRVYVILPDQLIVGKIIEFRVNVGEDVLDLKFRIGHIDNANNEIWLSISTEIKNIRQDFIEDLTNKYKGYLVYKLPIDAIKSALQNEIIKRRYFFIKSAYTSIKGVSYNTTDPTKYSNVLEYAGEMLKFSGIFTEKEIAHYIQNFVSSIRGTQQKGPIGAISLMEAMTIKKIRKMTAEYKPPEDYEGAFYNDILKLLQAINTSTLTPQQKLVSIRRVEENIVNQITNSLIRLGFINVEDLEWVRSLREGIIKSKKHAEVLMQMWASQQPSSSTQQPPP